MGYHGFLIVFDEGTRTSSFRRGSAKQRQAIENLLTMINQNAEGEFGGVMFLYAATRLSFGRDQYLSGATGSDRKYSLLNKTDDAERLAKELHPLARRPGAGTNLAIHPRNVPATRQHQRDRMLGNRGIAVALDRVNANAVSRQLVYIHVAPSAGAQDDDVLQPVASPQTAVGGYE